MWTPITTSSFNLVPPGAPGNNKIFDKSTAIYLCLFLIFLRRWIVSFSSVDELKQKIVDEFQIQGNFEVLYFDEEFGEYAEVDIKYLPKKAKLLTRILTG